MICGLHGDTCPSFKGGEYEAQPLCTALGRRFPYRNMSSDRLIEASHSECVIERIFALVALIRQSAVKTGEIDHPHMTARVSPGRILKGTDLDNLHKLWYVFYQQIVDDLWILVNMASTRVLISILDSFSDLSPRPAEEANSTMCTALIRQELLAQSTMKKRRKYPIPDDWLEDQQPAMWDTVHIPGLRWADSVTNTMSRMRKTLFRTPIIWIIYCTIVMRFFESEKHTLNYISDFAELSGHRKDMNLTILDICKILLQPSMMADEQVVLYRKKHKSDSKYGSRRALPPEVNIDAGLTILDLGCGKGNIKSEHITSYDPATVGVLPTTKFDVVLSLDVIEHVPLEDLPAFFQWLEIYARKKIYMLISTRPAVHTLSDGSNAHATVKNADWWIAYCKKILQGFDITRIRQIKERKDKDSVLLVANRKPRTQL